MNDIIRSIPMIIVLCYFLYLGSLVSMVKNTRIARSFRGNLFLSLNVSTVLVLAAKGLAPFIYGMQPSWIVFTAALLFCMCLSLGKAKIIGHRFLDSLLVSFTITGIASMVPGGIKILYQEGVTMTLVWRWSVISLLIAMLATAVVLSKWEKRESKRKRKNDESFGHTQTGVKKKGG